MLHTAAGRGDAMLHTAGGREARQDVAMRNYIILSPGLCC